jgi:hypothetical protein
MAAQRADAVSFIGLIIAYGWFSVAEFGGGLELEGMFGRVLGFYVATAVVMTIVQVLAAWIFGKAPSQDREVRRARPTVAPTRARALRGADRHRAGRQVPSVRRQRPRSRGRRRHRRHA